MHGYDGPAAVVLHVCEGTWSMSLYDKTVKKQDRKTVEEIHASECMQE